MAASGFSPRRRRDFAQEFALMRLVDEVKDLTRDLIRLRGAVREHLERPTTATHAGLRHELQRSGRRFGSAA